MLQPIKAGNYLPKKRQAEINAQPEVFLLVRDLPNCPPMRTFMRDIEGGYFNSMTDDEHINKTVKEYKFTFEEINNNLDTPDNYGWFIDLKKLSRKELIKKIIFHVYAMRACDTLFSCNDICKEVIRIQHLTGSVKHYISGSITTILQGLVKEGYLKIHPKGKTRRGGKLYFYDDLPF